MIARVALPVPLRRLFDYLIPEPVAAQVLPGVRVSVPFGKRFLVGVVIELTNSSDVDPKKLRRVTRVLDQEPAIGPELHELLSWASVYYAHPIGEVFSAALPASLRRTDDQKSRDAWMLSLTESGTDLDIAEACSRAPKQKRILDVLAKGSQPEALLRAQYGLDSRILNILIDKGWLEKTAIVPPRPGAIVSEPSAPVALNEEQQSAVDAIKASYGAFSVHLVHGVTGSGKTEVYLDCVQALNKGEQALILVPEIGLTPQFIDRVRRRIGMEPVVFHSALTDRQRAEAWTAVRQADIRVVLGTRSAVFLPFANLSLLVIDEEHDGSFKQQDGFRYSARDVGIRRAQKLDATVVVGSATPSLESLNNALQGRFQLHQLKKRASGAPPRLNLLDIRGKRHKGGISDQLLARVKQNYESGGQSLLFLNRRGFSPVVMCQQCGWMSQCDRCDARMTWHRGRNALICHHCGKRSGLPNECPDCGDESVGTVGAGTEQVESVLCEHFPPEVVLRIDRDTTSAKGALQDHLARARSGEARILVGTQMLAKGHDFPELTLVGFVNADQGLFSSDFRAEERMAQTVLQVAGRAGRGERAGEVLIQTLNPDHPILMSLMPGDYRKFAELLLQQRAAAGWPPSAYIALLRADAHQSDHALSFLDAAERRIRQASNDIDCMGPVPAVMERLAGRYRQILLLRSTRRVALQSVLAKMLPQIELLPEAKKVRWSVDVDPQDIL